MPRGDHPCGWRRRPCGLAAADRARGWPRPLWATALASNRPLQGALAVAGHPLTGGQPPAASTLCRWPSHARLPLLPLPSLRKCSKNT
ncbi:hypothetical protein BHE74_00046191 [Ensete ventricosum]|nr:hypothetical protein GW17_00052282 [Ensete ventricosum]RWW47788.1 hypothetical protein BHE74_00046191 [Ensete ventricosum]